MECCVPVTVTTGVRQTKSETTETLGRLGVQKNKMRAENPEWAGIEAWIWTLDNCESFDYTLYLEAEDYDQAREIGLAYAQAAVRGIGLPVVIREIG
jgi:hypothetical protein